MERGLRQHNPNRRGQTRFASLGLEGWLPWKRALVGSEQRIILCPSIDFRRGKDDTNFERPEASGLSRSHVDARLGPYLVRALASRVSISYLLRVSPDLCWYLRGRTGLRRWFNTILHSCTATTPDSEKRPGVNPSR